MFQSVVNAPIVWARHAVSIRFRDDNGNDFPDWEEKRLGDAGEIIGGGTPDTTESSFWGGDINWFTPTEIKSKFIDKSIRTISVLGLKNSSAKILPKGTLLLTSRATIGDVGIAQNECTTNQGFQSIVVNEKNNNEYIYHWVVFNKNKLLRKASGSTFIEINKTEISNIQIPLPSLPEQNKIAAFLSSLDSKISSVSAQVAATQKFKKGLLQQMFV
jgi:type I restriction enzyme S subunit